MTIGDVRRSRGSTFDVLRTVNLEPRTRTGAPSVSRAGVLLMAHGTPSSLDEMPEYLTLVRGGRPPSAELVHEMRENYGAIGGRSPLTDITQAQADALRATARAGDAGRGRHAQLASVHQGRARRARRRRRRRASSGFRWRRSSRPSACRNTSTRRPRRCPPACSSKRSSRSTRTRC